MRTRRSTAPSTCPKLIRLLDEGVSQGTIMQAPTAQSSHPATQPKGETVKAKAKKSASIDIGISEADRARIAQGLSGLLADSFSLYLMTHNFHWNVTGPMFNTLHTMFMTQYTEQWNALDLVAERIRALGHFAPGTFKDYARLASIKEVADVPKATDMIRLLVDAQEATARTARSLFPVVEKANDQPTMDLLTQRLEVHEKTAWMLRSLLEE
jgi:starvation-inducible DNA-binding protein